MIGPYCDRCAPRSFNLITHRYYKKGCLTCFCNGLDVNCFSSDLFYNKLEANFESEGAKWKLSDKFTKLSEDVDVVDNGVEFSRFDELKPSSQDLYFIVPEKFKDNKVNSRKKNYIFFKFQSI